MAKLQVHIPIPKQLQINIMKCLKKNIIRQIIYTRGDIKEAVDENFRRITAVFESSPKNIV